MAQKKVRKIPTTETVLWLYASGAFPMANPEDNEETIWHTTALRAVLPIADLHVSHKLRSQLKKSPFEVRIDSAFMDVMVGCTENRPGQWINDDIKAIFQNLHKLGHAHSVECWKDGELVGGVYGLVQGSAFCAESMFSRVSGASKVALVHLCARLDRAGFTLLDCQILNDHTKNVFRAYEIPEGDYLYRLQQARGRNPDFLLSQNPPESEAALVQNFLQKPKSVENIKRNLTIS